MIEPTTCGRIKTRLYFLSAFCQACKQNITDVGCEICKMVYYCSTKHRRQDWYQHSELCRAVYKIKQAHNLDHLYQDVCGGRHESYRRLRHEMSAKCGQIMGRSLSPWEYEVLFYPRICYKCYQTDNTSLEVCKDCQFVFTCNNCKLDQHKPWCYMLKTYVQLILYQHDNDGYAETDLRPLTIADLSSMNMKSLLGQLVDKNGNTNITNTILSEVLSYPLTIYSSLSKLINESGVSSCNVHFIGAESQAEVFPLHKWEFYLLHLLPQLKQITLKFIGPELDVNSDDCAGHILCQECRESGKELNLEFHPGLLYHDFLLRSKDKDVKLICALNAGLYRSAGFEGQDTWKNTIMSIFSIQNVLLVVTAYTSHELNKDLETIQSYCNNINVCVKPTINPFASVKPHLNIISDVEIPVIFKNYYYMIVTNR